MGDRKPPESNRRNLEEMSELTSCKPLGQRYVLALFTCFGVLIAYLQRACLYIALLEMVEPIYKTTHTEYEKDGSIAKCPVVFNASYNFSQSEFTWPEELQGDILGSFFYGYIILQIPGGIVSDICGAKQIFGVSVLLTSVCSCLTPMSAKYSPFALMGVRFAMGIVQGPMFPALTSLVSKWSPREERSFLTAIANSGVSLGLFVCNLTVGYILDYKISWEWIFYIFSAFGFFWFILWYIYVFPSPKDHSFITDEEKFYIVRTIEYDSRQKTGKIPWAAIFTSYKVLLLVMAGFGYDWGFHLMSIELPFYLCYVLRLPILKTGVISAIPWICMCWGSILYGYLSECFVSQRIYKTVHIRKIMGFISTTVPGCLLIVASYCRCSFVLASAVFSVAMFYSGAVSSGHRLTVTDLSPNFAGLLMSFVNCFGSITGILVPRFVHSLITNDGTMREWTQCFWVSSCIMVAFSLPYIIFAKTNVQLWNVGKVPHVRLKFV